ncbi:MAG: polysaccharide deacetylase family protein [Magnetococcales bacterium]|nr:polysaccharide deacetylase family protein [Magnetococcales bacterium]
MILPYAPIPLRADMRPILLVVVDTEETFAWDEPFDRGSTSVAAMDSIGKGQQIFADFAVRPVYVVDYPIANQEEGFSQLRQFVGQGQAVVGAHLHPWVSPPFKEHLNTYNSYPGNLPHKLEEEKLLLLTQRITASFGVRPQIYKAGRYGVGPNTTAILASLGYEVDLSIAPPFNYKRDGGPDFTTANNQPFWFGDGGDLLEIPCTGAFVGSLHKHGDRLYPFINKPFLQQMRLPGIISRLGMLERIRLTPEGYDLEDLIRLTNHLLASGTKIFTFSFHSPSLSPGAIEYVQDEAELQRFLATIRGYLDFFMNALGGESLTPLEIKLFLTQECCK